MNRTILYILVAMVATSCKEDKVDLCQLTTDPISYINANRAFSGGTITSNGGGNITECGICWDSIPGVDAGSNAVLMEISENKFQGYFENLKPSTTYYVKSFAKNEAGMAYGPEKTFTSFGASNSYVAIPSEHLTVGDYEDFDNNFRYWGMVDNSAVSALFSNGWYQFTNKKEDYYYTGNYFGGNFPTNNYEITMKFSLNRVQEDYDNGGSFIFNVDQDFNTGYFVNIWRDKYTEIGIFDDDSIFYSWFYCDQLEGFGLVNYLKVRRLDDSIHFFINKIYSASFPAPDCNEPSILMMPFSYSKISTDYIHIDNINNFTSKSGYLENNKRKSFCSPANNSRLSEMATRGKRKNGWKEIKQRKH